MHNGYYPHYQFGSYFPPATYHGFPGYPNVYEAHYGYPGYFPGFEDVAAQQMVLNQTNCIQPKVEPVATPVPPAIMPAALPTPMPAPSNGLPTFQIPADYDITKNEPMAKVNGRTYLLNNIRQHELLKSEVKRRVEGPENLQVKNFVAMMKKKKGKESNDMVESMIAKCTNVRVSRRKTKKNLLEEKDKLSSFSNLLEEEAVLMAQTYETYVNRMQCGSIAKAVHQAVLTAHCGNSEAARLTMADVNEEFERLLTPRFTMMPVHPKHLDEPKTATSRAINYLSLMTHGFGHNALATLCYSVHKICQLVTERMS